MKKIVLFLLVLFSLSLQAQKSINIACTDFTFNDKKSIDGKNTTDIFESALMQSTPLIRLLERKKLDYILSKIDEEKRLAYDFGEQTKKELILAGVDYVVTGNIFLPFGYDTATVNIQFTKISGKDVTTKFIIPISINREELYNPSKLKNEIIENLKKTPFVDKLGLIEKGQIDEIKKQLNEKDKRIKELEINEQYRKEKEVENQKFKLTSPDIDFKFVCYKDSFFCILIWNNVIPTKFELFVKYAENDKQLGNFIILKNDDIFYPSNDKRTFSYSYCPISQCDFNNNDIIKLKVTVNYQSIFYEEMNYLPNLKGVISKICTYDITKHEIVKIED